MLYNFNTESEQHARAALLMYAIYRSRGKDSPLNGLETWERFENFSRGACLKANTIAEFVQAFCKKAKVHSIKPRYLDTGEPILMPDGTLISTSDMKNYRLDIIADDNLLEIINRESVYVILLVRERIQREKFEYTEEDIDDED